MSAKLKKIISGLLTLSLFLNLYLVTQTQALAQDEQSSTPEPSGNQSPSNKASTDNLDANSLFGGVNFVKGLSSTNDNKADDLDQGDEIEGKVVVTTNPYTDIPKPTGILFGNVFDPPTQQQAQGANRRPVQQQNSQSALTGLGLLLGAMGAAAAANQKK